jgi:hypothetical protein
MKEKITLSGGTEENVIRKISVSARSGGNFIPLLVVLMLTGLDSRATEDSTGVARGLIQRLIPKQAGHFTIESIPADGGLDVFEIAGRDGKIVLRGNNGVSIASALNRYLSDFCHCDISWNCGNQLRLPDPLPVVTEKIRVLSPHRFRYAYNFCTHGYTMAWWQWPEWEKEIDFLAMQGINLALVIEGQEAAWVDTFTHLGYGAADIRGWVVDPAHLPWMEMDNMENYGGPLSAELIDRRRALGQKILARMRELGIEPVLPGYYGMVPPDFKKHFSDAKVHSQGVWGILKRPDILDPNDPIFAKIAAAFYAAQSNLFGGANFYAADPFHEGGSTEGIDISAAGRAILDAMGGATWVLQSWQANPRPQLIDSLDKNKLLVLDLFCEDHENWRLRDNFSGTPWLWCTIHNFGGNQDMGGRLAWMGEGPIRAMNDPKKGRLSGIGALMEGSQVNPVLWEYFFGNAWRSTAPDEKNWLDAYAQRRYGAKIPAAQEAWKILAGTIYDAPVAQGEYPVNSVLCARPSLDPNQRAREWASTQPYYNTRGLVAAWKLLLDSAPQAQASDGFRFDVCDVGRQVLANLAGNYHKQIIAAYEIGDAKTLRQLSEKMLGLIHDLDELTGTRKECLLGTWLSDARSWGETSAEKDSCERNARELLTTWTGFDNITDYGNRQWNGLLGSFYYHRWQMWLEALNNSLARAVPINELEARQKIRDWELEWTRQTGGDFAMKPQGDVVAISQKLFKKYSKDAEGTSGSLQNKAIAWNWRFAEGKLQAVSVEDKLNAQSLSLAGECFQLVLGDGTILKASDFALAPPTIEPVKPRPGSPVAAEHFAGHQLVARFFAPERNLAVEWRVVLRDGSTYIRPELTLRATGKDVLVKEIVLLNETVSGAKTDGTVQGSPVVAGNFFFGYEHPMAENTADSNGLVHCSFLRNAVLKNGETLTQKCVIGVVPAGQLRRGILAYVERERAHSYRPFLHYNSWYDISWANRKYDESQSLDVIDQFGRELVTRRGVRMASFLFDDGWDDNSTLWKFNSGFPNGFTPLKSEAAKFHAGVGVWLSPFGGYAEEKAQRLKYGSQFGFETNTSGFSLAGSKYYQRFHDICLEMVQKYGVNQFKFDGLAAGARASESGLTRDGDAMLRLIGDLRAVEPDIYVNQTTGTWPSPFWLLTADSTWRGGSDHWFAGKGSWCQQWMTYRDSQTYQNVVRGGPLYPLNSLMLHGIIYAKDAEHLETMTDTDFAGQVREFFGNGTQLQEMYITPRLLNSQNWDDLAEAAKWSRRNADVLIDTHWIGGDPVKGEVYGWASWSPRKGILVLRNPDDHPAVFAGDVRDLFQLPPRVKGNYHLRSPWKTDRGQPLINLKAGLPHTFTLQPYQVLVLETE